jgi:hypothetical protein
MTDRHTTLARADTDPSTPMPRRRAVLPCWQHVIAAGMLLGLFVWTIRGALHEQGAVGVWATIACWIFVGTPAALDLYDRAHGKILPPRTDKWT